MTSHLPRTHAARIREIDADLALIEQAARIMEAAEIDARAVIERISDPTAKATADEAFPDYLRNLVDTIRWAGEPLRGELAELEEPPETDPAREVIENEATFLARATMRRVA